MTESEKKRIMAYPTRNINVAGAPVCSKFDEENNVLYFLDESGELTGEAVSVSRREEKEVPAVKKESPVEEPVISEPVEPVIRKSAGKKVIVEDCDTSGSVVKARAIPKFHAKEYLMGMGLVLFVMMLYFVFQFLSYEGII